jgi:hypothetical protein
MIKRPPIALAPCIFIFEDFVVAGTKITLFVCVPILPEDRDRQSAKRRIKVDRQMLVLIDNLMELMIYMSVAPLTR